MSDMIQKIFSKIIAFILAVIASLSGEYAKAPEIAIKNDVLTSTALVQVQVVNNTKESYATFNTCTLEKKVGEDWVKMDYSLGYEPSSTAYIISSRQTVTLTIDVVNAFGNTLDIGYYRLSKELMPSDKYSEAMAKINAFVPDETLYPDAESKAAAKAAFEKATLDSVAKTVCYVEFSVNN